MIEVLMTNLETVMLIDEEDEDLVSAYKWRQQRGKKTFYAVTGQTRDGNWMLAHRLILGLGPGEQCDHRNRNGLDNRRSNLRIASVAQNCQNRGPRVDGKSRYAGVGHDKGRWRARIWVNNKSLFIGSFGTEVEAAQARDATALHYYGEYAYLNFPEGFI